MSDQQATKPTEGAVGAGIVLVLVPVAALVPGMDKISGDPIVGLPILAVFGIMILFGAMSLKAYAGVCNAGVTSNAATLGSRCNAGVIATLGSCNAGVRSCIATLTHGRGASHRSVRVEDLRLSAG